MNIFSRAKRFLVGKPIHTKHAHHERLPKTFALPVFASDALSSVAYATEEMQRILMFATIGGITALGLTLNVSIAIGILLVIVAVSYYQTIHAYPMGGGSYRVTTENLGSVAGRIAGASLLIDYVLTVAVSVSSGVLAIVSMAPAVQPYIIEMGVLAISLVGLLNLRGARESGVVFAIPTYSFVLLIVVLIITGLIRALGMHEEGVKAVVELPKDQLHDLTWLVMLRTFAAGCTALTGVEAISDGVQAFRPPEARNASITLSAMAGILLALFIGTSWLAQHYGVVPMSTSSPEFKTVVAQICEKIFGHGIFFFTLQVATAMILILAANTAFADFPRLSSFIARDGYLPRQLSSVGDRMVFQNGIILLSILAIVLIIGFHGDTHKLIPLYAVGVFTSFTLSQAGMFIRQYRTNPKPWGTWVSGIGCIVTGVVTVIILVTKFEEGAWIIVVALLAFLTMFWGIRRHYNYLAGELSLGPGDVLRPVKTTVLLLVPRLHRGVLRAIAYATSMTKDVRAVHVTLDPATVPKVKEEWDKFGADIPLVILESPYRSLIEPVLDYIDQTIEEDPDCMVTVIVPQAVPKFWWQGLLHNNAAIALKLALGSRKNVVITNVRYFLK